MTSPRKGAAPGVAVHSVPGAVDDSGNTTVPQASGSQAGMAPVKTAADLPDRRYFRIGEVATLLGVKPYVLRYWETEFPQVRPQKSRSGQRLYRRREVEVLLDIRALLYDRGYTIAGARKALREMEEARLGGRPSTDLAPLPSTEPPPTTDGTAVGHASLRPTQPPLSMPMAAVGNGSDPPLPSLTPQRAEQLTLALAQVDNALLEELRDGIRDLLSLCREG